LERCGRKLSRLAAYMASDVRIYINACWAVVEE
jgi:hypothetical protein